MFKTLILFCRNRFFTNTCPNFHTPLWYFLVKGQSHKYDSRTTIFSPDGRLFQIEYALEAINKAGTAIGIVCSDGILLACEKRTYHELLVQTHGEKIYKLCENTACCVSGVTSDGNKLIDYMRSWCEDTRLEYQEGTHLEQLVSAMCNHKQAYTLYGSYRPFGVSFLYVGWNERFGYQLFQSDPSGNYSGWNATCIGQNNQKAITKLKTSYKPGMTLAEALPVSLSILQESLGTQVITFKNSEFAFFTRIGESDKCKLVFLNKEEIEAIEGNEKPKSVSTNVHE